VRSREHALVSCARELDHMQPQRIAEGLEQLAGLALSSSSVAAQLGAVNWGGLREERQRAGLANRSINPNQV